MGAAIARRLKGAGHSVAAIFYGNVAAAETFHAETGIPVYRWDVADFDACQAGIGAVCKDLGEPVDILINNAGITRDAMLHKMTAAQWNEVIGSDLTSCFNMSRAVIGPMRERGFGRIINISSINGQKGQLGQTNYSAAKAGMLGFTRALALENASKGITVNAVAAGYVETDMTAAMPQDVLGKIIGQIPVGRLGDPDEIARIVAFLTGDDAGFITGATITANGGQYMA
jgi:acetoacetyl-CoA reductase